MRFKIFKKINNWMWLLLPLLMIGQAKTEEIKIESPSQFLNTPSELLNYYGDIPFMLITYCEEDRLRQLELNATEDLLLTSLEHSSLNGKVHYYGIDREEITPFSWLWVELNVVTEASEIVDLKLRRPKSWLKERGLLEIGDKADIEISDLGVSGNAELQGIYPNTFDTRFQTHNPESNQRYRPIIGLSKRYGQSINQYQFTNGDILKATPGHIIWSETHERWTPISTLEIGEEVLLADGSITKLKQSEININKTAVYSIEVYRDHNYYVSESGILVHNNCIGAVLEEIAKKSGKSFDELHKQLLTSGALKRFLNPDTGELTDLGKKFDDLADETKELLLKDVLDRPKLADDLGRNPGLLKAFEKLKKHDGLRTDPNALKHFDDLADETKELLLKDLLDKPKLADDLGRNPGLLKAFEKLKKHDELRTDADALKHFNDLDDGVMNLLNDMDGDLLQKLSTDLASQSRGGELKGLLKTADDIDAYRLLKEKPELVREIDLENPLHFDPNVPATASHRTWKRWSQANFFKFITQAGKDFEVVARQAMRNKSPFDRLLRDGFEQHTQVYLKRSIGQGKLSDKFVVADDLLVRPVVNQNTGRVQYIRAVFSDSKLRRTSPWTENQKTELLNIFKNSSAEFVEFRVRSRNLPDGSVIKYDAPIRIYRNDVYKAFGDGNGNFQDILKINAILNDL